MSYQRRSEFLPFTRPVIGQAEIDEIIDSIQSGWITTGPKAARFEEALKAYNRVPHCLAVNSATTGLEMGLQVLGLKPGDEVITTAMTFVCTLSMVVLQGGVPVLVDTEKDTLNMDPACLEAAITPRTVGIIPIHFAGLPCRMEEIYRIARKHGLWVMDDAAQAMGAHHHGRKIGSDPRSAMVVYSFQANKNLTTGEGGAIAFHDDAYESRIKALRFHGIERDAWKRFAKDGSPHYEVVEPARKANFLDILAAIGIHQLEQLEAFTSRREILFRRYLELLEGIEELVLPSPGDDVHRSCFHLFVLRMRPCKLGMDRDAFVQALKDENIGTGIHYLAAHRFPYYRDFYRQHPEGLPEGGLPNTEWSSDRLMSLPLWPGLAEEDQDQAVAAIKQVVARALAKARNA